MRTTRISGDIMQVEGRRKAREHEYALIFFQRDKGYLLFPDGAIEAYDAFDSKRIEFVCHSGYVHSDLFESIEQVRRNFKAGLYRLVFKNRIPPER